MDVLEPTELEMWSLLAHGVLEKQVCRGNGLFIRYYKPLGESDRWKHRQ